MKEVNCLKQTSQQSSLIFRLFLYIPVIWAALLIAPSLGGGLPDLLSNLTSALEQPFQIQWTDKSLLSILVCTGAYLMGLCLYASGQGRTRDGEEHGSAAWGSPRQLNAQFRQKQNKILTRHVRLGLDTHKHRRSLNVLVIGGSGAAKPRGYVKPNILEANTNYVITDPKMEVLTDTGGYLKKRGYDVRVLNLVNLEQSDGYNPFCYLRDEKDALKLVNTLIQATTPKGSHESDPFWTKSETALLQAIILMLYQEAPEYEQNFSMVLRVLEYAEVKEDDDEYVSPLDLLFKAMEYENPESVALRQYRVFKQAAGKTAKSILISAAVRLAVHLKGKDAKKYRKNVEYGSARWGNKTDIAPFMDPKPENNVILTQSEGLMLNGRPKNPAHARNKNVLVVGGSGSGKTRFFIKPNLMQMHSSYVVTDPKGTVLVECGKMLQRGTPKLDKDGKPVRNAKGKIVYEPYKIRVFNTINFQKSMHFNPFAYIHSEKDILKIVTTLIANTKGEGKAGDDFWVSATRSQAVKSLRTVLVY